MVLVVCITIEVENKTQAQQYFDKIKKKMAEFEHVNVTGETHEEIEEVES